MPEFGIFAYLIDNHVATTLLKLLKVTDYAIMQQSLVAGNLLMDPIYSILFTAMQSDDDINLVMKILKSNTLLANNFSANLVRKNIGISNMSRFLSLYAKAPNHLSELNQMVILNNFKFVVGASGKIEMSLNIKGKQLNLPAPDIYIIASNEMQNTSALYGLIETRKRINEELIDLTFTQNLKDGPKVTASDFKYSFIQEQKPLFGK